MILSIIFIFLLALVIALYIVPIKAAINYNTDNIESFHVIITWLSSIVKIDAIKTERNITLKTYLFDKKIFSRELAVKSDKINNLSNIKKLKPYNIKLNTSYGFQDPSVTGVFCGALNLLTEYFQVEQLYNNANFSSDYDYIHINALADFNALSSLINLLK